MFCPAIYFVQAFEEGLDHHDRHCPHFHTSHTVQAFEEGLDHHYPHLIRKDQASLLIFRMGYRTVNTVVVSIVAASVPHFSLFAGLIGALTFWPLSGRPAGWCCFPASMRDHARASPCMHTTWPLSDRRAGRRCCHVCLHGQGCSLTAHSSTSPWSTYA